MIYLYSRSWNETTRLVQCMLLAKVRSNCGWSYTRGGVIVLMLPNMMHGVGPQSKPLSETQGQPTRNLLGCLFSALLSWWACQIP